MVGDSSGVSEKLTDIKYVFSNEKAFVALKNDGTVVSWGNNEYGGDSSSVQERIKRCKKYI